MSRHSEFEYSGNGQIVPKDVVRVRFHPNVVEVGVKAFWGCNLKEVVFNELVKIGEDAFAHCTSLERISIPYTVTDIDEGAFYRCSSLREVVLNEGLVKIGKNAFLGCESLESITLPSTVMDIDELAFQDCSGLKEVVLNEGLVSVGKYAFQECQTLESITLPSTVTNIEKGAFYRCSGLKKVVLNDGTKKIETQAFYGCESLERINLPSSLVEIGRCAFQDCSELSEVVCIERLPNIKHDTFDGCSALERITFPIISSRLEDIIQAGQVDIQNKVQQYVNRGEIEWRRGDTICIPVEVTKRRDGWSLVERHFHYIVKWIKYYEMKEATTLFELALWKAKIDQVEEGIYERGLNVFRVDVPGPVKDAILQYLDL